MGLNVSHGCFQGSCMMFDEFRNGLAAQLGERLTDFVGYGGGRSFETLAQPVGPLFNLSDTGGELTADQAAAVASCLEAILNSLREEIIPYPDFKKHLVSFRNGCADAASEGECVRLS